ncbi:bifunctional 23S rRNA (guanine(2069)-N(7))-methyltransferase RlmK/23S rRNA (guanine(2445)-N(2))-methyltransferase RlmL [Salinibius halmophilus]|uniref:bifunctional 23S rRNA (guanine(2069)-N(7))-methyltransferase RlmK/23S rRNA (guanine(2445)-N(2))-methyltransferase RlmL n=1 Tax=Salinibius halmophilus TaxID=1853216 RepID=UPI000E66FA88|nr:bifunctional 23S rRNA (guanine(2069)-N(7))-methyltransferase RlmK/23S rRNA (guanine(2445)-N(2))-methyltransferase RlmL [Salinibius halmophilus]
MVYQVELACPYGVDDLLAQEVEQFGLTVTGRKGGRVQASAADLQPIYHTLLWSRIGTKLVVQLAELPIKHVNDLYDAVKTVDWLAHITSDGTFQVRFSGKLAGVKDSRYPALKAKDAIVDQFREQTGLRPSVERDNADVYVDLSMRKGYLVIGIDLAGPSLGHRGYREGTGAAPLREPLAAALLLRAGWPGNYQRLIDPLCGTGTILTEAFAMSADIAPGLARSHWGVTGWKQHDAQLWTDTLAAARQRRQAGQEACSVEFVGNDQNPKSINLAIKHMKRLGGELSVTTGDLESLALPATEQTLILTNPPYGERLGDTLQLADLYRALAAKAKEWAPNGQLSVVSSENRLLQQIRLPVKKKHELRNGPLTVELAHFDLAGELHHAADSNHPGEEFGNRLRKNLKRLRKEAQRANTTAYRVYDADLPEFAVAVDVYNDHIHVQEYQAPKKVPEDKAQQRLFWAMEQVAMVFECPAERIHLKQRAKQKGKSQYNTVSQSKVTTVVHEGEAQIEVNLSDYLDTGLFLDHRVVRQWLHDNASGKSMLNLFSYTATASLQAALGGGETTSVDLSNTYLNWAKDNFARNDLRTNRHRFIQADVLQWLADLPDSVKYDLIFVDPPTFSNSKRMDHVFDVQRDHGDMLYKLSEHVKSNGQIIFSNNYRRFKLDETLSEIFNIEDISAWSIPFDFKRNQKIHQCWRLTLK